MRWAKLGAQRTQPEDVLRDHLLTKVSELLYPRHVLGDLSSCQKQQRYLRPCQQNSCSLYKSQILCFLLPGAEQGSKGSPRWFPRPSSLSICREVSFPTVLSELVHRWENFESKSCRKSCRSFQSILFAVELGHCSLRGARKGVPRPVCALCPQVGHRRMGLSHPAKPQGPQDLEGSGSLS